jgi:YD repeat-containing protein
MNMQSLNDFMPARRSSKERGAFPAMALSVLTVAVLVWSAPAHASLLQVYGGQDIFMNCLSVSHSSAEPMTPGCQLATDDVLSADLDAVKDQQCHAFGYDRYGPCTFIEPMHCSLNMLSSWSGCEREYHFEAWDCHTDNCHRPARNFTTPMAKTTWVDYSHLKCPPNTLFYRDLFDSGELGGLGCISFIDRYRHGGSCPAHGNPIYSLVGGKRQSESLGLMLGGKDLSVVFDNRLHLNAYSPGGMPTAGLQEPNMTGFGADWSSSLHRRIKFQVNVDSPYQTKPIYGALVQRGAGLWESFEKLSNGSYQPNFAFDGSLVASGGQFTLTDKQEASEEVYDAFGVLTTAWSARGGNLAYTYSTGVVAGVSPAAGLLISVADQFGRSIQFRYELAADGSSRIYKVVAPDGQEIQVGYSGANSLATLTWPDGKVRTFAYERAGLPWALTGVNDELGKRYATFDYDGEGHALSTEHAGGTNKYVAGWTTPPTWQVTETFDSVARVVWRDHSWIAPVGTQVQGPLGGLTAIGASVVNGAPRQTTLSQPGGSGCGASDSLQSYDSRGNVTSKVDFNDVRSCHAYATDRHVETYRVEGLGEADACPADLAAYQVPGGLPAGKPQRKVSTKWHSLWNLEARRAEPKRITTTVYNGEADPLNNNVVASCVTGGDPRLPDNSRIAVVCTRYEQSTDDETGSLGFDATAKETRKWSYTYNTNGQVLTETDPRNKVSSYEYYADTSFVGEGNAAKGHWMGDLKLAKNALQQKTEYLEYNKRGQVLTTKFANGSQELREYHARGWLTKVTLLPAGGGAGQATLYTYYDTGLLKKVTQPDGSFASYTWDDAHRLTDVTDSVGNKVHYELDNAGNRTGEQFKDPQGTLAKTITRTFDALGRMSKSTGLQ